MNEKGLTKSEKERFEEFVQAAQEGYIKRCPNCGSLRLHVYTDEDYFTDMTRCTCQDCKKKYYYNAL